MLFINNDHLYSLQYQLYKLINDAKELRKIAAESGMVVDTVPIESMKMALTVVVTGPIILLYPFVQRYFIKGLTPVSYTHLDVYKRQEYGKRKIKKVLYVSGVTKKTARFMFRCRMMA